MARRFCALKYLAAGLAVAAWAQMTAAPALALDTTTSAFPLQVSADGRHIVDHAGKAFRINADAAWFMSSQGVAPEVDEYLDNRKLKGFNTVVLMLMTHLDPINRAGQGPFTVADDFSTPNEAYFSFIDTILDKAAARGMVVLLAYTYLGYQGGDEGWWSMITNAKNTASVCYEWGLWLGRRYGNRANIIWLAGGDFSPPAGSEGERRVYQILKGLKAGGAHQLVSAQWAPPDSLATDQAAFVDVIDINTIYGYGASNSGETYRTAHRAYQYEPTRPVVLFEPSYEGQRVGGSGLPQDVRRSQYWAVLGGATAGQNFGTKGIWDWQQATWLDRVLGRQRSWRDRLETPGALDMQRQFTLFHALRWQELVPAESLSGETSAPITGQGDGSGHIALAVTRPRTWLVAYIPPTGSAPRTFGLNMSLLSRSARARWYNPTTGDYVLIDPAIPNNGLHQFTTPGENGTGTNDWLLVADTPEEPGHRDQ